MPRKSCADSSDGAALMSDFEMVDGDQSSSQSEGFTTTEDSSFAHDVERTRFAWIYRYVPRRAQQVFGSIATWTRGPEHLVHLSVRPIISLKFLDRLDDRVRWWLTSLISSTVILSLLIYLSQNALQCEIIGFEKPLRLSCISRPWQDSVHCGLDGQQCRPFHHETYAFRCPANCASVEVLEPYTIGDQVINYRSLVVGGPVQNDTSIRQYRGDSFICGAAIHAGIIENFRGGAGLVKLIGEQSNFLSSISNGIESVAFTPRFPLSFTFEEGVSASCTDPRWVALGLTIAYTLLLGLFTSSTSIFFSTTFVSAYFCVALAADAPEPSNYYEVISLSFRGFLPAAFVGYVIYRYCVKRTLHGLNSPIDLVTLWLFPFWIGAVDNLTFDKLPIQRLTPHDLRAQPGAIVALIVILLCINAAAIGQILAFRHEGRLRRYLLFYAAVGACLLLLLTIPNMNLRLHHYILALILLPGTAIQTRPSLIYQGLLVGLFINGIARWGFDSIIQTPADLFATDPYGLVPHMSTPFVVGDKITFSWDKISAGYDSVSVLVNDVERYRGYEDHESDSFSWTRDGVEEPTYFRFGYVKYGRVGESSVGRYSKPGTWLANGTWIGINRGEE